MRLQPESNHVGARLKSGPEIVVLVSDRLWRDSDEPDGAWNRRLRANAIEPHSDIGLLLNFPLLLNETVVPIVRFGDDL